VPWFCQVLGKLGATRQVVMEVFITRFHWNPYSGSGDDTCRQIDGQTNGHTTNLRGAFRDHANAPSKQAERGENGTRKPAQTLNKYLWEKHQQVKMSFTYLRVFYYLPTYLSAYLPTYLSTYLPTCYLPTNQPTYLLPSYILPTYHIPTCHVPTSLPTNQPTYLPTYLHTTYLPATYLLTTHPPTYLPNNQPTYVPPTYLPT